MSGMNSEEFIKFALETGEHVAEGAEKVGEHVVEHVGHHVVHHVAEEGFNILDLDDDGSITDTVPDLLSAVGDFIGGLFG